MAMERRIGFVVEGDLDKAFVEALTPRLLGEAFRAYAVRIGGRMAVRWAYSTVLMLLEEKHYPHVVLLLDADTSLEPQIQRRRREIEEMLKEHHLAGEDVSVCLAVPQIEAWLLAEYEDRPEESKDPKRSLMEHLQANRLAPTMVNDLARTLDLAKARARSPSFDAFARTLERVAHKLDQAPAA